MSDRQITTVKAKLGRFIRNPEHQEVIRQTVENLTPIIFEATSALELVFLRCLADGQPIPMPTDSTSSLQAAYRRALAAVCRDARPAHNKAYDLVSQIMQDEYRPLRKGPLYLLHGLGPLLDAVASEWAVNAMTHLAINLPRKFLHWARFELSAKVKEWVGQDLKWAAKRVLHLVLGNATQQLRFTDKYPEAKAQVSIPVNLLGCVVGLSRTRAGFLVSLSLLMFYIGDCKGNRGHLRSWSCPPRLLLPQTGRDQAPIPGAPCTIPPAAPAC